MPERRAWVDSPWLALALVIVVAACLRYPALDQVPPGLNFDEGGEGIAALDVTHGIFRIWWPIGGGKEPLMAYLVQPLFWLLGPTRLALRLYTATLGVVAAGGTFWLAWEMQALLFSRRSERMRRPSPAGVAVALLAGLGLATAFWHVAYSRIAFRALAMPAVEALAMAWLWHALLKVPAAAGKTWRDIGWPHFAAAGACIGLCAYTYLAGRFVPVAIVLFLAVEAGLAVATGQRPLLVRQWRGLLVATLVAGVVFAPLGAFFAGHPAAFLERAGSVSIFNPAWHGGNFWGALADTLGATLGTFAGLTGDPNPLGNLPGRPMLPWPLAVFFWVGVAACVWKVAGALRRRGLTAAHGCESPLPYLFLLCWWPVMLLPGILAPEGAPHHLRLIGTAPATYVLIALGCVQLVRLVWKAVSDRSTSLARRLAAARVLGWRVLPLVVYLPIGLLTAQLYFGRWVQLPDLYMAFDVYAVELAQEIAADRAPEVAYVIPMDLRAADEARQYTLDYMYHGDVPYHYLPVDDRTTAEQLTRAAGGARTLRVVRWTQDKHVAADEREVVTYLLATTARRAGDDTRPAYHIETWELPSSHTVFQLPVPDRPLDATFEGRLKLEAVHLESGDGWVGVALGWAPLSAMAVDYKASLRLVDLSGHVVAQHDRALRHNWHQGTRQWPLEAVDEYYLLAPAPPGEYHVRVVVYDPDTLAPLIAGDQAEVTVGTVRSSDAP